METGSLGRSAYEAFEEFMANTSNGVGTWDELPENYKQGYEVMAQEAVRLAAEEAA